MPLVTVLTAVHRGGAGYLAEAARSAMAQDLPEGWELEWIVQEDGEPSCEVRDCLPVDDRLRLAGNGERLGPSATRNIGLSRARGKYVQNLDADDILLPGALLTIINAIEDRPQVHWAFGQADDLMPDGSRRSFPPWIPPFGLLLAGRLNEWVVEHEGNWPIPCAGILCRTATLRAIGGWVALPLGGDIAMIAAMSQVTDGWQDAATTWLYRQHPEQISRHHLRPEWSEVARRVALQRAQAARLTSLDLSGVNVDPEPIAHVGEPMKTPADLS